MTVTIWEERHDGKARRVRATMLFVDSDEPGREGDVNTTPRRAEWQRRDLDADTRRWLEEDERYFLRQALSTPCLDECLTAVER